MRRHFYRCLAANPVEHLGWPVGDGNAPVAGGSGGVLASCEPGTVAARLAHRPMNRPVGDARHERAGGPWARAARPSRALRGPTVPVLVPDIVRASRRDLGRGRPARPRPATRRNSPDPLISRVTPAPRRPSAHLGKKLLMRQEEGLPFGRRAPVTRRGRRPGVVPLQRHGTVPPTNGNQVMRLLRGADGALEGTGREVRTT